MDKKMRKHIDIIDNAQRINNEGVKEEVEKYMQETGQINEWKDPKNDPHSPEFVFQVIRDPNKCGGRPIIKGTRWPVHDLAWLGIKDGVEATVKSYRRVTREMVEKSMEYIKGKEFE